MSNDTLVRARQDFHGYETYIIKYTSKIPQRFYENLLDIFLDKKIKINVSVQV